MIIDHLKKYAYQFYKLIVKIIFNKINFDIQTKRVFNEKSKTSLHRDDNPYVTVDMQSTMIRYVRLHYFKLLTFRTADLNI